MRPSSEEVGFALRYEGKMTTRDAEQTVPEIVTTLLMRHLEWSEVVVMEKPGLAPHPATGISR
ncbi:MAG: hypothetical protein BGO51_24685 [Rhodospirillales bacterium 69-11]|nr:hypothetical protein [Rhodospirillales bacterium]MBN8928726.1 hypothetical protein [Rhodospirillales bacterium]OJW28103.1 MAG: hypothetical protein BGO51_24685 [Rhodospirillales bacterium 69-11]